MTVSRAAVHQLEVLYQDARQIVVNKPVGFSLQGRPYQPSSRAWEESLAGEGASR